MTLGEDEMGVPRDFDREYFNQTPRRKIAGRKIPPLVSLSDLERGSLPREAVPLPEANTLSGLHYRLRRFGRLRLADGRVEYFNPQVVLVKFRNRLHVAAVRVAPGRELDAVRRVTCRSDVVFAELDTFERRASFPDDPEFSHQWHHRIIRSAQAWRYSLGRRDIHIAILDTPFEMDHPDLAPHTVDGWDAVDNTDVTNSSGIDHSTLAAGMAAAVINNGLGVAGAGNCTLVPININGAVSEIYDAAIWAADHGVRVVSISWTGADSDTINAAAQYLKTHARGLLAMAGDNRPGLIDYTNQPDIWCVSMTDAADNVRSAYGPPVDFAAPGWKVFSTTTHASYSYASGTSYSTPLFCGVVALLFSINPTLGPDDVIAILKDTAVQPNGWAPGWNRFYGWGRINSGAAAAAAETTRPAIVDIRWTARQIWVSVPYRVGLRYSLWRRLSLNAGDWTQVTGGVAQTNGSLLSFRDPAPPRAARILPD